jgi:hypothetical protein
MDSWLANHTVMNRWDGFSMNSAGTEGSDKFRESIGAQRRVADRPADVRQVEDRASFAT